MRARPHVPCPEHDEHVLAPLRHRLRWREFDTGAPPGRAFARKRQRVCRRAGSNMARYMASSLRIRYGIGCP